MDDIAPKNQRRLHKQTEYLNTKWLSINKSNTQSTTYSNTSIAAYIQNDYKDNNTLQYQQHSSEQLINMTEDDHKKKNNRKKKHQIL